MLEAQPVVPGEIPATDGTEIPKKVATSFSRETNVVPWRCEVVQITPRSCVTIYDEQSSGFLGSDTLMFIGALSVCFTRILSKVEGKVSFSVIKKV